MKGRPWLKPLPVTLALATLPVVPVLVLPPGELRLILAASVAALWAFWLSVAAHEAGHLLGGKLAGFRWSMYVAGPLKVRRTRGSFKVEVNDRWLPMGMAVSIPSDHHNLRRRIALMLAGGPGANLLLGLIAAAVMYALLSAFPSRPARREWLQDPAAQLAFMLVVQIAAQSLFQGVVNLVPLKEKGMSSDGARILMLLRGGQLADRWCAIWSVYAASAAGERPRDWDAALVRQATSIQDGAVDDAGASLLAYSWALDRGDVDAAGAFLARARELVDKVPILGPSVAAEAAYFTAHYLHDGAAARALLADAHGGTLEEHARLRAEAATLLAEGDRTGAQQCAQRGLEALANASSTTPGTARAYDEWLREIAGTPERVLREQMSYA